MVRTTTTARGALRTASRKTQSWIPPVARLGYAAKGIVYFAVGILALQAAFMSGSAEGTKGAIAEIGQQPFGSVLLWVIGVGLVAYVIWRFVQAIWDTEDKGTDFKGIAVRIGYAISGLTYGTLAGLAMSMAGGGGGAAEGSSDSKQALTAQVLSYPGGRWAVGIAGLVIVGIAVYQFIKAYKASFMEKYDRTMDQAKRTWARRIGRTGLSARGVTFLIIGGFVIRAAYQSDASEAKGLDAALAALAAQPFGTVLLALTAAGLAAYGVYCVSQAFYRKFEPTSGR